MELYSESYSDEDRELERDRLELEREKCEYEKPERQRLAMFNRPIACKRCESDDRRNKG